MLDVLGSWKRLMVSGVSIGHTGANALETMGAAGEVIAARMPIIGMAIAFPMSADHAELSRMVPEKAEAFSRAGLATVVSCCAAQAIWLKYLGYIGDRLLSGRTPTPCDVTDLGNAIAMVTVEAIEAAAQLGADALAPIHREAVANAQRLSTL